MRISGREVFEGSPPSSSHQPETYGAADWAAQVEDDIDLALGQAGLVVRAVTPRAFGAVPDANVSTGAGTDSKAALDDWLAYIAANDVVGFLDGIYKAVGQIDIPGNVTIRTNGKHLSGLLVEIDSTESAVVLEGVGGSIGSMTIWRNLTEPKAGDDSGHLGNTLRFGNYINGAQTKMGDMTVGDMHLTDVPGSHQSPALGFYGRVSNIKCGKITLGGDVSLGCQAHWSGNITAIGQTVTESYHPHDISIEELSSPGGAETNMMLVLSSVYNFRIGRLNGVDVQQGIYYLPGDETDDFDVENSGMVGRGNRIDHATFHGTRSGYDQFIAIRGNGASKFRTDAAGNALQKNLDVGLSIGNLTVHGSGNISDCIDLFNTTGLIEIEKVDITGFSRYDLLAERSTADVVIGSGRFTGGVRLQNSGNIKMNVDVDTDAAHGVYVYGNTYSTTLAASASVGDTSVSLSSGGLGVDVLKGDILTVGTQEVVAAQFCESDNSVLPVEPLEAALTSGDTIELLRTAKDIHLNGKINGAGIGVRAIRVNNLTLEGAGPQYCKQRGWYLTDSYTTIVNPHVRGTGDDGSSNYDLMLDGGLTNLWGGTLGESPALLTESVYALNDSIVNFWGVTFATPAKSASVAGTATANFTDCYDKTGAAVTG